MKFWETKQFFCEILGDEAIFLYNDCVFLPLSHFHVHLLHPHASSNRKYSRDAAHLLDRLDVGLRHRRGT